MRHLYFILMICILSLTSLQFAQAAENIIFMRHTLAPGYGDPANFQIYDCSTQRNLSDEGRSQAETIGKAMRAQGLTPTRIFTSPWCRCKETAEYLKLGEWSVHEGLGSFFQGHVDRDKTLSALNALMEMHNETEYLLLVTHQVVIQAVTALSVQSGGLVAYNPETRIGRIIQLQN